MFKKKQVLNIPHGYYITNIFAPDFLKTFFEAQAFVLPARIIPGNQRQNNINTEKRNWNSPLSYYLFDKIAVQIQFRNKAKHQTMVFAKQHKTMQIKDWYSSNWDVGRPCVFCSSPKSEAATWNSFLRSWTKFRTWRSSNSHRPAGCQEGGSYVYDKT